MRVIGAGFGRTGTLSLKRALEDLGFGPTYHMQEVMRRPSHIGRWLRYARSGEVDWDELFSGFRSAVDYPVSCVWEELASHYPDAKVVLSVRDPQQGGRARRRRSTGSARRSRHGCCAWCR
jgi:Sulfotransferase domain